MAGVGEGEKKGKGEEEAKGEKEAQGEKEEGENSPFRSHLAHVIRPLLHDYSRNSKS